MFRGDREKGWSWVHIDDLAEAYRLVAEADRSVEGEVFCLADELRPRCVDVMRACLAAAGYHGEITLRGPLEGRQHQHLVRSERVDDVGEGAPPAGLGTAPAGNRRGDPCAYAAWKAALQLQ